DRGGGAPVDGVEEEVAGDPEVGEAAGELGGQALGADVSGPRRREAAEAAGDAAAVGAELLALARAQRGDPGGAVELVEAPEARLGVRAMAGQPERAPAGEVAAVEGAEAAQRGGAAQPGPLRHRPSRTSPPGRAPPGRPRRPGAPRAGPAICCRGSRGPPPRCGAGSNPAPGPAPEPPARSSASPGRPRRCRRCR